ncbi:CLUMA_CG007724, isoform A [Clunio marinus]|uniref:CLUMA_CG007724, isoform A n=1 Tax=Clunio marinus TaxID=568069 RepID=A0A1J1I711_9DIPT|nr:CLUMA_CG007724, isoform A [Clunio marinus]
MFRIPGIASELQEYIHLVLHARQAYLLKEDCCASYTSLSCILSENKRIKTKYQQRTMTEILLEQLTTLDLTSFPLTPPYLSSEWENKTKIEE